MTGDVFYLRIRLNHEHSKGKASYLDLQTVNGHCHETFQEACRALGFLQDDTEWDATLRDAAITQLCPQIREFFADKKAIDLSR